MGLPSRSRPWASSRVLRSRAVRCRIYGFLFLVVDPGALLPGNPFAEHMSQLVKAVQTTPRRPGVEEIRIPSQRAFRERERRRAEGILVDCAVIAALEAL